MIYLITGTLLIFGYAVAYDPDPGCDTRKYVATSGSINNIYSAGRTCRYVVSCPQGYSCRADCYLYMPWSSGCTGDRLVISESGDEQLTNADAYCGIRKVSAVSVETDLVVGLFIPNDSKGGSFMCNLTAQMPPVMRSTRAKRYTMVRSCSCGESKQDRIVGGAETKVNEFPMMIAILERRSREIHCGATIIAKELALTAAHCVDNYRNTYTNLILLVGAHDIRKSGTLHNIRRLIIHENYDSNTYFDDIALVRPTTPFVFNNNVQAVCLPFQPFNLVDTAVTLLGWGTDESGGATSNELQKVKVNVISYEECVNRSTTRVDDRRQICTYTRGKDACQLDSGGPVLRTSPYSGSVFIVGIISNGNSCGLRYAGINTRISNYLRWIQENSDNVQYCSKRE